MHTATLLDHFQHPRNVGRLPPPAVRVEFMNPVCGDQLVLTAEFHGDRVVACQFQTRGCTASIAAGSVATEICLGKTRAELAAVTAAEVEGALGGLPNESKHAAVLAAEAVRALSAAV